MVKHKIGIEGLDPDKILQQLAKKYINQQVDLCDGLKIDATNTWVHMRKSNTEPVIRVIAEAPTVEEAERHATQFIREIKAN